MIVKLLTEHHLEFLSLTGGCRGSSENVKLLEISCHGSNTVARNEPETLLSCIECNIMPGCNID